MAQLGKLLMVVPFKFALPGVLFVLSWCGQQTAMAQDVLVPKEKRVTVVVDSKATPETPYLAFPTVVDLGKQTLISFKSGRSHAADTGASIDCVTLNEHSAVTDRKTIAKIDGEIMQMGEWVLFPNGHVANYIDAQKKSPALRTGLCVVRSENQGQSFSDVSRVGVIDGVEYGYAFDSLNRGTTTFMLVMTFANLPGGKQIFNRGSQPGSVDVIKSEDNGRTWRFVRAITAELGDVPINESAFVPTEDGYLLVARGYDSRQWLARLDKEFRVVQRVDLAARYPFIRSVLGRPRLFTRDGNYYLLARNTIAPGFMVDANQDKPKQSPMRLSMFRINPQTLDIDRHFVLDNSEGRDVADGYYAMPFWRQSKEQPTKDLLRVITYKRLAGQQPNIIQLEFDWSEISR